MKFCPICGTMLRKKGNKWVCANCGYEEEASPQEEEKPVVSTKGKSREAVVFDTGTKMLPKTRIKCPRCGNMEAYYIVKQTRSADEPETIFYICTKCGYRWRQYREPL